jgi:hypothetical protein
MLFAALHESAFGTKRTIAALQQFVRYWTRADIEQPPHRALKSAIASARLAEYGLFISPS